MNRQTKEFNQNIWMGGAALANLKKILSNSKIPKPWLRHDMVMSTIAMNILSLALPIVILQTYDRIIPYKADYTFAYLLLGLAVALVLESVLRYARTMVSSWLGASFEHRASVDMVDQLLQSDPAAFYRRSLSYYLDKIIAIDQVRDFFIHQVILVLIDLPFALLFIVVIGVIAPPLGFLAMAFFVGVVLLLMILHQTLGRGLEQKSNADDHRYGLMMDVLQGIHTVKGVGLELPIIRRYEKLQEQSTQQFYQATLLSSLPQNLGPLLSQTMLVLVASCGAIMVVHQHLTVGGLAAITLLSGRAIQPLLRSMGVWTYFQNIKLIQKRLQQMSHLPKRWNGKSIAGQRLEMIKGQVEFKDVTFAYSKSAQPIMDRINLMVNPFEIVAIVGANGSGKSTLLRMMAGMLRPTAGQVLLDGHPVQQFSDQVLQQGIGLVSQHAVLFQGTLIENLTLFHVDSKRNRAYELCQKLGLMSFINALPQGMETEISNVAVQSLPYGIQQRICMVRALIHDPALILFDDANASLDLQADHLLKALLESYAGRSTMILVTQRPVILSMAQSIYRLHKGQLILEERRLQNAAASDSMVPQSTADGESGGGT